MGEEETPGMGKFIADSHIDKGVLRKADSKGCKVKTTKKSINRKTGRAQFQGNEHLRSTQY